jgi:hypothetical protein
MKSAIYIFNKENKTVQFYKGNSSVNTEGKLLVLGFSSKYLLETENIYGILRNRFPNSDIVICSTAGEICHTEVMDKNVCVVVMELEKTPISVQSVHINDFPDSFEAGKELINCFDKKQLSYVLVLSDGEHVNGSSLVKGMNYVAGDILVTGGLAGDGDRFKSTLVGVNEIPREGVITGIGFYGEKIKLGHGSKGGWETFGLEKLVTRSAVNVLYEIDGKNALEMYKQYLGAEAEGLPASALLFPLAVVLPGTQYPVVRTILSIDNAAGSMTFAGDIPEGSRVRLMRANLDRLTNAASLAAVQSVFAEGTTPDFALLISCVGRKLILHSRIEEEVEAIDEVFSNKTLLGGFYSYGELSPLNNGGSCQLHNQTMTITTFYEVE